eukprot:scaffold104721_cov48-Phaeocystis_antarctica.AAC.3
MPPPQGASPSGSARVCKGMQGCARGCTAEPRVNLRVPSSRHEADVPTPSLTPRAMVRVTSESPA